MVPRLQAAKEVRVRELFITCRRLYVYTLGTKHL